MGDVLVRGVPDEVKKTLEGVARARGTSMQSVLVEALTRAAHAANNRALLARLQEKAQGRSDAPTVEDTLRALHEGRAERDRHIDEALGGAVGE